MRKQALAVLALNAALAALAVAFWPGDAQGVAAIGATVLAIGALCWLPFLWWLSAGAARLDEAARQISAGQLDAKAPEILSSELGSLGKHINLLARRLEGTLKNKKRFLGDAAHELSAPIARIQATLGLLEVHTGDEQQADLQTLYGEIQEMSALVNEMLSFSRAGLDISAVSLSGVNVLQLVQRVARREGIRVQTNISPQLTAQANELYLRRALGNLLRNARRYAGGSGPIEVRAEHQGYLLELIVADRGPGVPSGKLAEIFEPFYRVDASRARETGGVGLGLAIVKSCVEACGGTVSCRNRQPSGLEVVISLKADTLAAGAGDGALVTKGIRAAR